MKLILSMICGAFITLIGMIIVGNNGLQIDNDTFELLIGFAVLSFIARLLLEPDHVVV